MMYQVSVVGTSLGLRLVETLVNRRHGPLVALLDLASAIVEQAF